jgi:hypothetical protein
MHRSKEEATPAKWQPCRDAEKLFELFLSLLSPYLSFNAVEKELKSLWNQDAAGNLL